MFVCIRFATMLGRHSANAPPNCSIQNKKIRNSEYYKEKKESLKAKKVRYDFKIELNKEEEGRLESLKMKIASIKKELHLDNKLVPAANARFMEILVDNWLVHNAKTEANGLETAHFMDLNVFAYLFTKPKSKQAKNLPLCGRLKNYFVRISWEYDTPG